ncbi:MULTISPECIES: hypothetical protein [unclassified Burkholderia]|uniref:hypothetical protein n=1 Tax=unclassified Burkholderia TaxID=2613784 RepID=UPI002AAF52CE|nr:MULTISPECIES: hypothetical protein [unclassified Burkholderia]
MATVHLEAEASFDELRHIGVAISGSERQRHTGVLYQFESQPVRLLHLAFHHALTNESPSADYGWVQCQALTDDEAHDFAMWINEVWAQNANNIPYSINYWKGAHFSPDGKFVPAASGDGLTCATFVMALFENFGWELLDTENWSGRDSDREFQQNVVDALANPRFVVQTEEARNHREAQIQYIGSAARFRPEEVTAAVGDWDFAPIPQDEAEAAGEDVLDQMREKGMLRPSRR